MPADETRSRSPSPTRSQSQSQGLSRQASALTVHSAEGTNTQNYPIAPRYSFGTRSYADSAQQKEAPYLPGPATYGRIERTDLGDSVRKKGSAYSFGYKNPKDPTAGRSDSPGPGNYYYSVDAVKPAIPPPALKGRGADRADKDQYPGPGQYQGIYERQVGKKGTWRFGSEARIRTKQTIGEQFRQTPSPGAYDIPVTTGEGPKHSFGIRNDVEKASEVRPSPADYDPQKPRWQNPPKFSLRKKTGAAVPKDLARSPGPGAYDAAYRNTVGSAVAASLKPRIPIPDPAHDGPGPAYAAPAGVGRQVLGRTPSAPAFGFGTAARIPRAAAADGPGPGAYGRYGMDAVKERQRAWSLYGKARPINPNAEGPGPGQYVGSFERQIGKKGVWRLYGADRAMSAPNARAAHLPGPGAYDPPSAIGETSKWVFGEGHGDHMLRNLPGRDAPGAGAYNVRTKAGRQVESLKKFSGTSIGSASRFGGKKGEETPGPGYYDVFPETLVPEEKRLMQSRSFPSLQPQASDPSFASAPEQQ